MITAYKKLNVALLYITLVYISEFPFIMWVKLQLVGELTALIQYSLLKLESFKSSGPIWNSKHPRQVSNLQFIFRKELFEEVEFILP